MKKQNLLTRMLLLFALIVGSTSVWAEEKSVTFDFTKANSGDITSTADGSSTTANSMYKSDIQISATIGLFTPGSDGTGEYRVYKNGVMTVEKLSTVSASTFYIKSIVITYKNYDLDKTTTDNEDLVFSRTWSSSSNTTSRTCTYSTTATNVSSVSIKNSQNGQCKISKIEVTYELVADSRLDPEISFTTKFFEVTEGDAFTTQVPVSNAGYTGSYSYSSDKPSIVEVDEETGTVTIKAKGTAVITARTNPNDETYQQGSASYTIKVSKKLAANQLMYESFDTNDGNGGNDGVWKNITTNTGATSDVEGWTFTSAYAGSTCVRTGNGGSITTPALGISGDITINFKMESWGTDSGSGYVDIVGDGTFEGNKTQATVALKKEGTWTDFSLAISGVTPETKIKFYNNKRIFLDEVEIYVNNMAITVTNAEYATYCGVYALDFSSTGITVFTATDNETSVKLNEITSGKVPANTPVVLYKEGADGTAISVPVIASADAPEGTNDLHVVGAGGLTGEDNIFVLAKNPTVGFYLWDKTKTLNEGKIYLQGKASYSSSRQFLGFEENTTGIGATLMNSERVNNEVYNLAGQRVAQPTKGLYIVNGKKVAIK
ncbi:MAG: hypothetical protein IJ200_02520 [Prevotella sp.]|nr:hypothetical protein [Prevotella sp.]